MRRNRALAGLAAASLLAAGSVALADTISTDSDPDTIVVDTSSAIGDVNPGQVITRQASFTLVCAANRHVDLGQTVALSYNAGGSTIPAGGAANATGATIGPIPASWPDDAASCTPLPTPLPDNGNSSVTLTAPLAPGAAAFVIAYSAGLSPAGSNDASSIMGSTPPASYSMTVRNVAPTIVTFAGDTTAIEGQTKTYSVAAADANGTTPTTSLTAVAGSASTTIVGGTGASPQVTFNAPGTVTLRLSVSDGVNPPVIQDKVVSVSALNSAPGAPGAPSASASPNRGIFDLSWTAAIDPDDDPVTYELQHRDADDAAFATVASGIATNGYSFGSGDPEAEGTFTYRAQATDDQAATGPFSLPSAPVVVDTSAPDAPDAAADRGPEDATGDWFRDSVMVSFSGNGDPDLQDGSPGSGVASVTAPITFSTSGSHTATGTATDEAGNESAEASLDVRVDATDPSVSISAPATVVLGSAASATVTAADDHSGLAIDPSGSVALDTTSVGAKTVEATATDRVGRSKTVSAAYTVVFDFAGFFQPVDSTAVGGVLPLNRAKAGSAIPVKFSLKGNRGLAIFASGSPSQGTIPCAAGTPVDDIEQTVSAGASGLSYDPVADQYVYAWKTDKAWAGTCRRLTVKLVDGTSRLAHFNLTR